MCVRVFAYVPTYVVPCSESGRRLEPTQRRGAEVVNYFLLERDPS